MLWAGTSFGWRTDFHIAQKNLPAKRDVQEIILNHVLNPANTVGRETLASLDDNAMPRLSRSIIIQYPKKSDQSYLKEIPEDHSLASKMVSLQVHCQD